MRNMLLGVLFVGCQDYQMVERYGYAVAPVPSPVALDTAEPGLFFTPSGDPPIEPRIDCENGPRQQQLEFLTFPARQDCPWAQEDNLARRNGFNQARVTESMPITLPAYSELCEISIGSVTDDLEFDDYFTFTLNDWILVGGGGGYDLEMFAQDDGLYRFDWSMLSGRPFGDRYAPYYCIGEPDSLCVVPPTEEKGPFELRLDPATLQPLADALEGEQELDFALRTFGDNDNGDCAHTDIELVFLVEYVAE